MNDESKEIISIMTEMFGGLNSQIVLIQQDLQDVKKRVTSIETTLENTTNKNIGLLSEGYQPMAEKLDAITDDVEVIKFDVDIVKKVVTTHSRELNKLGQAK